MRDNKYKRYGTTRIAYYITTSLLKCPRKSELVFVSLSPEIIPRTHIFAVQTDRKVKVRTGTAAG